MTLQRATRPNGSPLGFDAEGPIPAHDLMPIMGEHFRLPCDDPWLQDRKAAGRHYLDSAREAWTEHPDYMDFLDEDSPVWDLKRAERDLYLHHWKGWDQHARVMDVGCGIGRFTTRLLDAGATVWAVDGDHESLVHNAWHAAGRAGSLSLHWSTAWSLPDVEVDAAVACEVLCYLPDPAVGLRAIHARLRAGGTLYLSLEARYGWAASQDAPAGALEAALGGTSLLEVPGERLVHLVDEPSLRALLAETGFEVISLTPTHYFTDGPLEDLLPEDLSLEDLLALEERARKHPVWAPLNRIYTVVARKA